MIWHIWTSGTFSDVFSGGSSFTTRCHLTTGRTSKSPQGRAALCSVQSARIQRILNCFGNITQTAKMGLLGKFWIQVTATWIEDHVTAPVWLFLRHLFLIFAYHHPVSCWPVQSLVSINRPRKDQLPERGNAQWTDAFYRGRRSSRIQVLGLH